MGERPIRESKVEKDSREYAMARGWWVAKFVSPGLVAVPDRIFIRNGVVLFIEFKRPGEEPTLQQYKRHKDMRDHGAIVLWVDNLDDFKNKIKTFE